MSPLVIAATVIGVLAVVAVALLFLGGKPANGNGRSKEAMDTVLEYHEIRANANLRKRCSGIAALAQTRIRTLTAEQAEEVIDVLDLELMEPLGKHAKEIREVGVLDFFKNLPHDQLAGKEPEIKRAIEAARQS